VEESNLSRCVLFRESDIGRNKAECIAEAASGLDPGCGVKALRSRVQDLDLRDYDIYVGCLDSISARLHMNAHAKYYSVPYVDGSTDGFRGKVQVVLGDGPCMECTMNRTHLQELHRTFSCAEGGRVPEQIPLSAGITTTSVIAGMCAREVIKVACGRTDLCLKGICYYDGITGIAEVLEAERNPHCPNHEARL
jgi:molybdopterin-synthase adenylyltransferase